MTSITTLGPNAPASSIRQAVREALILPRGHRYLYILHVLVLTQALSYWALAYVRDPDAPSAVDTLYRPGGDLQYWPLIASLAEFNPGESTVWENRGQGISSFPFMCMLPHALCLRLGGAWGFAVADVLGFAAFFLLLTAMLRLIGIRLTLAVATSAMLTTGALQYGVARVLEAFPSELYDDLGHLRVWGMRIQRPFITEIYQVAAWCVLIALFRQRHALASWSLWAALGICTSLLLQGNFHSTVSVALATAFVMGYTLLVSPLKRGASLARFALMIASAAVVAIPFFIQRAFENPDIPVRFGMFPLDRFAPLWLKPICLWRLALVVPIVLLVAGILHRRATTPQLGENTKDQTGIGSKALFLLAGLSIAPYIALPLNCIVLGKGVQLYHYRQDVFINTSYALIATVLLLLQMLVPIRRVSLREPASPQDVRASRMQGLFTVFSVVIIGLFIIFRAPEPNPGYARPGFLDEQNPERAGYRQHFVELVRELTGNPQYAPCRVALTLDTQVHVWWTTFNNGYVFLPDVFSCTLSDDAIERRHALAFKLLGVNHPQRYASLLNLRDWQVWWLAGNKYQATETFSYAPKEAYPPAVRDHMQKLAEQGNLTSWHVWMPDADVQRLRRQFEQTTLNDADLPRCDLVILTPFDLAQELRPDPTRFRKTFQNEAFEVWIRRSLDTVPPDEFDTAPTSKFETGPSSKFETGPSSESCSPRHAERRLTRSTPEVS